MTLEQFGTTAATVAPAVSAIASILCNLPFGFAKPYTVTGKVLHFLAFNFNVSSLFGGKPPPAGPALK